MNNPNMYTNKRKSKGIIRYFIIWLAIIGVFTFFIVRALSSNSKNEYNWNINEVEYALGANENGEHVDSKFDEINQFNSDNIQKIVLNIGYIKSYN